MVRFLKYKFYNKLLVCVILLRIIPGVTWIQLYIYIYIYRERERERERRLGSSYTLCNSKQCYSTQYFFNQIQILTNLPLYYIIFIYS